MATDGAGSKGKRTWVIEIELKQEGTDGLSLDGKGSDVCRKPPFDVFHNLRGFKSNILSTGDLKMDQFFHFLCIYLSAHTEAYITIEWIFPLLG